MRPHDRALCRCPVPEAVETDAVEIHEWNAMQDEDAFVAGEVRIMQDGSMLAVDPQRDAIW